MASFEIAYQIVRRHEGAYQKHPNDSGNYNSLDQLVGTNWGINAMVYESYLKRPPSESDMRSMSRSTAVAIYKVKYWNRIKGDAIQDQYVANILFDGHVNHGYTGIKLMQRVLKVDDDGIVGPITLDAINHASAPKLYNDYKNERIKFYHWLAVNKPRTAVFLEGWLNRINRFKAYLPLTTDDLVNTKPSQNQSSMANAWPLLLLAPFLLKSLNPN